MPDSELSLALGFLERERSTGCLAVNSPSLGSWRIYLLLGKVVNATGPGCEGDQAVAQALACKDATSSFDSRAHLPEEQNVYAPPQAKALAPDVGPAGPVVRFEHWLDAWGIRHWTLFLRSSCLIVLLVVVVLPVAGVALSAWRLWSPTTPEAHAAVAYENAPICSGSSAGQDCIKVEQARFISYAWVSGNHGSHTDTLTLELPDGIHVAHIFFDTLSVFAPNVVYADTHGRVRVREYRGLVTTVSAANGTAYETWDSPSEGASDTHGVAVVTIGLVGPWVLLLTFLAIRYPGGVRDIWRLLRNPNKSLAKYPQR